MIRLQLTDDQRAALQTARRDPTYSPAERDRVEMVLLSATGWSPPAIAQHLGYCAATVRTVLKAVSHDGCGGVAPAAAGARPEPGAAHAGDHGAGAAPRPGA